MEGRQIMTVNNTVVRFDGAGRTETLGPAAKTNGQKPEPSALEDSRAAQSAAAERFDFQEPPAAPATALGRGLDVGTANLLSVREVGGGELLVMRERNAFLEIPSEFVGNREMLTKLRVPYVQFKDRLFVLGDAAFNLANMFGNEVRRPMQHGFLAPGEQEAIPMIRFIVQRLLGEPAVEGEEVCFCIPASSIDRENDTVYHEAHAIVYSSLGEHDFTGIGISCGAGMFNVCVAYKTIPALTFSVARGGDWIDEHVARVMGIPGVRATALKESDIDLMAPRSREEEAIALYYRNLISYVLQNFRQRFMLARDVPQFTEPVEVVIGGGTSLVAGFVDIFAQEIKKVQLPIPIAGVRRADDALSAVVRGCLIAAKLDERKGANAAQ